MGGNDHIIECYVCMHNPCKCTSEQIADRIAQDLEQEFRDREGLDAELLEEADRYEYQGE